MGNDVVFGGCDYRFGGVDGVIVWLDKLVAGALGFEEIFDCAGACVIKDVQG